MGQRSNYAALKDAKTKLNEEECASSMEQNANCARLKGAQI